MANACIVACDQHLEFIFFLFVVIVFYFYILLTPSLTHLHKFIYITTEKAHIESYCLICVMHVLIENNVLSIQNCTCVCEIASVSLRVYVLCCVQIQIKFVKPRQLLLLLVLLFLLLLYMCNYSNTSK